MILFTIYDSFIKQLNDGDGRKIGLTPSNALVDVYLWRRASLFCREYNSLFHAESIFMLSQLTGAVEYTDCASAEG